jgi:hypothetical protein
MAAAAGWVQKVLHSYSRATAERPYRTNILTAGSSPPPDLLHLLQPSLPPPETSLLLIMSSRPLRLIVNIKRPEIDNQIKI